MYNIIYSVCGEGLGHLNRLKAILPELKDCRFHILTYGDAYTAMDGYPFLHKINGYNYIYNQDGSVNLSKSLVHNVNVTNRKDAIKFMIDELEADLVITDYEPFVPKIANSLGVPTISIDNQHLHSKCSINNLSLKSKIKSRIIGLYSDWLVNSADHYIISHFSNGYYEMVNNSKNSTVVDPFISRSVADLIPTENNTVIVYTRNASQSRKLLPPLEVAVRNKLVDNVVVFGDNSITHNFKNYIQGHREDFKQALVDAKYVISTAGSMIISECKYFNKKLMIVPESGQFEQEVNAELAERMFLAYKANSSLYNELDVVKFMTSFIPFRYDKVNGVKQAASIIRHYLTK